MAFITKFGTPYIVLQTITTYTGSANYKVFQYNAERDFWKCLKITGKGAFMIDYFGQKTDLHVLLTSENGIINSTFDGRYMCFAGNIMPILKKKEEITVQFVKNLDSKDLSSVEVSGDWLVLNRILITKPITLFEKGESLTLCKGMTVDEQLTNHYGKTVSTFEKTSLYQIELKEKQETIDKAYPAYEEALPRLTREYKAIAEKIHEIKQELLTDIKTINNMYSPSSKEHFIRQSMIKRIKEDAVSLERECPITMEKINPLTSSVISCCSQVFHTFSIQNSLSANPSCPCCRESNPIVYNRISTVH